MKIETKNIVLSIIGILISLFFIVLVFHNINFKILLNEILQVNMLVLFLYLIFILLNTVFRSFFWKITTSSFGQPKFINLFGGVIIGSLVNNFVPLRIGDFYRAYYLAKKNNYSKTSVLSTILIERIFDIFSLSFLLFLGIIYGIKELKGSKSSIFLVLIFLVFLLGIFLLVYLKEVIAFIESKRFLPNVFIEYIKKFLQPFFQIANLKNILFLIVFSFFMWLSLYFSILTLVYNVGDSKYQCAFILLIFLYLGLLIPSSPGALGIVQVAFWLVLVKFGLSKEQAISLSIVYQGIYYLFTIVFGFPFLVASNIYLKKAFKMVFSNKR